MLVGENLLKPHLHKILKIKNHLVVKKKKNFSKQKSARLSKVLCMWLLDVTVLIH